MKTFPLPKTSLLTEAHQYNKVYNNGKRIRGKGFSLIFLANHRQENRLGISISGVRLAVKRNRLKRIIKEFYRHNRSFPSQIAGYRNETQKVDMVIATRKDFSPSNMHNLSIFLLPLLQRAAGSNLSCN